MFQGHQNQSNYSENNHPLWRMPFLRHLWIVVATIAVIFGLFGCQPVAVPNANEVDAADVSPIGEETIPEIALPVPPFTLDPQQTTNQILAFATFHLYETLLTLNEQGRYTYTDSLSQEVVPSDDQTSCIFKLRQDVRFSNNMAFTAAHVLSSWQRRKESGNDPWNFVANAQVVDDQTVQVTPKEQLCTEEFLNHVAPGLIVVHPDSTPEHPIGTGPYQLASWIISETIVLEHNPYYREPEETSKLARLRFQYYPSLEESVQSADVVFGLTITESNSFDSSEFTTIASPVFSIHRVQVLENPAQEVDRDLVYEVVEQATDFGMPQNFEAAPNDPEAALSAWNEIVDAAGTGVEIKIYEDVALTSPFARTIESQLDTAGINTDLDNSPFSEEFSENEIPLLLSTWTATELPATSESETQNEAQDLWGFERDQVITWIRTDAPYDEWLRKLSEGCWECAPSNNGPPGAGPSFTAVEAPRGSVSVSNRIVISEECNWVPAGGGLRKKCRIVTSTYKGGVLVARQYGNWY